MSLRERPTLPAVSLPMKPQAYFRHVEFELFDVRSLEVIEMIAEKVRAAFQRAKVRDLYDLHCFATTPFDGELLRRLVVLKLWQVRIPFTPDAFLEGSGARNAESTRSAFVPEGRRVPGRAGPAPCRCGG